MGALSKSRSCEYHGVYCYLCPAGTTGRCKRGSVNDMSVGFGLALDFWSTKKPLSQHLEDCSELLKLAEGLRVQLRMGR